MIDLKHYFLENRGMEYNLTRSHRRTISLEIKNGELVVRAPHLMPRFLIEKFVSEKRAWIEKTLKRSKATRHKQRRFVDGEKYLFLGEQRTLEFGNNGGVDVDGEKLTLKAENEIEARTRLRKFYKLETARQVKKYFAKYSSAFNVIAPKITYKFYKSKWGSCSAKNDFSFNALLSMAPEKVIEYVVIHELAHTQIKNHSKRFWVEVGLYDPEYKTHRKWLRDNHHKIVL